MDTRLQLLQPHGRQLLAPEQYARGVPASMERYVEPFPREVDLEPLESILREGMNRFDHARRSESDAWLAPRVHATLRLSRREAGNMSLWYFLSVACRDYIVWRWARTDGGLVDYRRITGRSERHALSRLWWAAELIRNGPDYEPVQEAFALQTGIEFILSLDAFHNRAATIAFVRYLLTGNDGQRVLDEDIKDHAHALNHVLTTVVLDDVAPEPAPEVDRLNQWIHEAVDETLMYDRLPVGPDDDSVPEATLTQLEQLIAGAATGTRSRAPQLVAQARP